MPATLRRDLGLTEAVTIVVGSMIGSGIFLGVDGAARLVPSAPLLLLVFLLSGLIVLMGALTYGELASIMPESGGHYAYIRNAYGPLVGFLQGWNIFTIAKSASLAALAVAFAAYLGFLVPMGALTGKLVAIGLILLLSAVNIFGVRYAGWLSNLSTFAKVGALAVLVVGGLLVALGVEARPPPPALPAGLGLLSAFGAAMVFAMFAYDGWANSTQVAEEVRDPQRNVPRSLLIGVVAVMATYLAVIVVYVAVLGAGGLAATDQPAPDVARVFAGRAGGVFVVVAVLVSVLGTTNAVTLSGPRIYFAMARDGVFPRRVAEVHPRFGTPVWSITAQAAWTIALIVSASFFARDLADAFDKLLTTVIFMSWIFYGLGAFVVILFRWRHPELPRPYKVPGYPIVPWVFVIASAAFTLNTLVTTPFESILGVAILASSIPFYFLFRRMNRAAAAPPPAPRPPSPGSVPEPIDEALVERYLDRLAADARPWRAEAAARELGMRPDEVYAAVARLAARGRVDVRYARGELVVTLR